jgi:hypothetical protein
MMMMSLIDILKGNILVFRGGPCEKNFLQPTEKGKNHAAYNREKISCERERTKKSYM